MSPVRADRLIQEMRFDASQQVLDVGCGTGELLSHRWRNGYLRWDRNTMGFGFYVFRNG
jgi:2-polyprenyl-3-methyl-5-hydroxy-6-metoxy-1,4-benzoquinol methylase